MFFKVGTSGPSLSQVKETRITEEISHQKAFVSSVSSLLMVHKPIRVVAHLRITSP